MPHFIIDCAKSVLKNTTEAAIISQVYQTAVSSELFDPSDIKVRVTPFEQFSFGGKTQEYIHVFSHIMQGRTEAQRAALSKLVVSKLTELFPDVPFIAMNIYEFEKSTYNNRNSIS